MSVGFCQVISLHLLMQSFVFFNLLIWIILIDFRMLNQPCKPWVNPTSLWCLILFIQFLNEFSNILWGFLCLCSWVMLVCDFFFDLCVICRFIVYFHNILEFCSYSSVTGFWCNPVWSEKRHCVISLLKFLFLILFLYVWNPDFWFISVSICRTCFNKFPQIFCV